ncbi:MAG: alpha-glucuronidase family glycosyl hydrolase [Terracidiphilus sp.]
MSQRSRVPQVPLLGPGIAQISLRKLVLAVLLAGGLTASAQTADQAWLGHTLRQDARFFSFPVHPLGEDTLERTAATELKRGMYRLYGVSTVSDDDFADQIVIGTADEVRKAHPDAGVPTHLPQDAYWIATKRTRHGTLIIDAGGDERGSLYGAFALLRLMAETNEVPKSPLRSHPALPIRWVDDWDNPDGSVERGYAGRSIFFEGGSVRDDLAPVAEYARLLASVGINGCNLNNVNGASPFLTSEWLHGVAKIADAMRPWGVRLALSVDIASPQRIGGLGTFDPLDPAVKAWWNAKVNEIYTLIPDFAGFTVKADSEGQPGPASYGRTPADAANLLAAALQPHGGIVLYRAFVYNHHLDWRDSKADRARAAYDIFQPLDGQFAPNVVIQTKEGPIDFQAREPVSPLFAGLRHASQALEVEVTQEYTGQQRHLVYLAPMWKQVLDFDLRAGGRSTPVKEIVSGTAFHQPLGGMVAVGGVGRDAWLGSPLALANLYAFGRLAWNPDLAPDQIAAEWTKQTISTDPLVVSTVTKMLMQSWPAYVNYTGPLGAQTLTDITGSHYGPNIESSEGNGWGQWHRDDHLGIGMDRSVSTGTGFVGQYPLEVAKLYESAATTPDDLLLFFHHVPYTYRLHSGKTVIQHIYDSHYDGAAQAAQFVEDWATLEGRIDQPLYEQIRDRLVYQAGHAIVWRDAIVRYFLKQSGIPDGQGRAGHYPGRLEAEDARLSGYKVIDVVPWEDASGGKAVTCSLTNSTGSQGAASPAAGKPAAGEIAQGPALYQGTTLVVPKTPQNEPGALAPAEPETCTADWTYAGPPGRFDIAVQYFDLQGGSARFSLEVNGQPAASWAADAALPSTRPNGDNSTRRTVQAVDLKPGDVLRITGTPDGSDPAALDYVEIAPAPHSRN